MKRNPSHKLQRISNGEPDVDQGCINGYELSFNPDDNRFYVTDSDGGTVATFKEFRNAVQWSRNH